MSDNLYDEISKSRAESSEDEKDNSISQKIWLLFRSGGRAFAIESFHIKEILRNNDIFPIPFVPDYVKGVLNFYGKPYAVVDFSQFLDGIPEESSMFMILNGENDMALKVSDIYDFYSSADITEQKLDFGSENGIFSEAVAVPHLPGGNTVAPVLNVENIVKKLRTDVES